MASWEQIVRCHAASIVNAAFRVLGNSADAEDVAQEVFLEAFQRWQATQDHQWAGLLRRMAVCRSLDLLRKTKSTTPLQSVSLYSSEFDPSEIAIAGELEERLRAALLNLTPREAEVFCLHYFAGQSQPEIAAVLEIRDGAVATSLHKARSRLAHVLFPVPAEDNHR